MTEDIRDIQNKLTETQNETNKLNSKILVLTVFNYFREFPELRENYKTELSHLITNSKNIVFPYKQFRELETIQSGYDKQKRLPYIIHKSRRLYFPKTWFVDRAVCAYRNLIENEDILGGGYKEKAPHQYETESYCVKKGDIVMDIGCAEGLFALDTIDNAEKIYLIESNVLWIEALQATFEPYNDKVVIINKLIADTDSDTTITLESLLKMEPQPYSAFVKMDIEGHETSVIESSKEFLRQLQNSNFVCCSYHKQDDALQLEHLFLDLGYTTEFSDGYMLFIYDNNLQPPYFRKGVVRARK